MANPAIYRRVSKLAVKYRENKNRALARQGQTAIPTRLPAPTSLEDLPVELLHMIMGWVVEDWARKLPNLPDLHAIMEQDLDAVLVPARALGVLFSGAIKETRARLCAFAYFNLHDSLRIGLHDSLRMNGQAMLDDWAARMYAPLRVGLQNLELSIQLGGYWGHVFVPAEHTTLVNDAKNMLQHLRQHFPKLRNLHIFFSRPSKHHQAGQPKLREYFDEDEYKTSAEISMLRALEDLVGEVRELKLESVQVRLEKEIGGDQNKPVINARHYGNTAVIRTMTNWLCVGRILEIAEA